MEWSEVWRITAGVIASVGGIGAVFSLVVKFASNIIAEQLSNKYELKMNMELEKYKSSLDNKIYMSKTKFDTEFKIYRELTKSFFETVKVISAMIPYGLSTVPANEDAKKEYEEKIYTDAKNAAIVAQDVLNSNAPFISKDFFDKYSDILELCRRQFSAFERRWLYTYVGSQEEKEIFTEKEYERTKEISISFSKLNSDVREYLSKIDIMEVN